MKIRKKIKRSTRQYITVALICILVIGGAAIFASVIITSQIRSDYKGLLNEVYKDMELNQRTVYVASSDISSGEVIREDKVERMKVYSSQPQDIFLEENQLGKTALVNISSGTQILKTMITNHTISSKIREIEYNVINLSSNIMVSDTVDIRIFYPNGESYVVLSKKELKGLITETSCIYLWMEEEELLRMSAAIVDAGLYPGSRLYVTKYIEPNIQEASLITYTPSLSILSLIENDPNIIERCSQELSKEVRKALENRLANSMGIDVTTIDWDVTDYQFQHPSSVDNGADTSTPTQAPIITDNPKNISDDLVVGKTGDGKGQPQKDYMFYAEEEDGKGDILEYGQ